MKNKIQRGVKGQMFRTMEMLAEASKRARKVKYEVLAQACFYLVGWHEGRRITKKMLEKISCALECACYDWDC